MVTHRTAQRWAVLIDLDGTSVDPTYPPGHIASANSANSAADAAAGKPRSIAEPRDRR